MKHTTRPFVAFIFVIVIIMFFAAGCGKRAEIEQGPLVRMPVQDEGYETPGEIKAHEILPPELLKGEHYTVDDEVVSYGYNYHFTITSSFGRFDAYGEDILRKRLQEIEAIAAIQEIKKTSMFAEAAKQAALSPFKGAARLVIHPVDTVTGVPKGMWRFMTRVGEMVTGDRGDAEEGVAKELIGFSAVKRYCAYELGVDVYSSNKELQRGLNSLSWAGFSGGAGIELLLSAIPGTAGLVIQGASFTDEMNEILRDNAPEDLRRLNRKKLKEMGTGKPVIKEFLNHHCYTPRNETILVHALAEMEGAKGREGFIKLASSAEYGEEAFFFQRYAEMMAGYHKHVEPINEIIVLPDELAIGYTDEQVLVIAMPLDYLHWTKDAAVAAETVAQLKDAGRPAKRLELWVSGGVTARTKQELEALGVEVQEHAFERLMPRSTKD